MYLIGLPQSVVAVFPLVADNDGFECLSGSATRYAR